MKVVSLGVEKKKDTWSHHESRSNNSQPKAGCLDEREDAHGDLTFLKGRDKGEGRKRINLMTTDKSFCFVFGFWFLFV